MKNPGQRVIEQHSFEATSINESVTINGAENIVTIRRNCLIALMRNFSFCHNVSKLSAADASKCVCMWGKGYNVFKRCWLMRCHTSCYARERAKRYKEGWTKKPLQKIEN